MDTRLGRKLLKMLLNQGGEEGFSLIELVVVIAVLAVFSSTGIIAISDFIRKSEKVVAQNSILRIKFECESNRALNESLKFSQNNLLGYSLDFDDLNNCSGNPNHGFITLIPTSNRSNPSFHYQFHTGQLSCSLDNTELTPFPECKKVNKPKGGIDVEILATGLKHNSC